MLNKRAFVAGACFLACASTPSQAQRLVEGRVIAQLGEEAPGAGGRRFDDLRIDEALFVTDDVVAFHSILDGDNGIWLSRSGQPLELLILEGNPLPAALGAGMVSDTFPPRADGNGLLYAMIEYDDRHTLIASFDPLADHWTEIWNSTEALPLPDGVRATQQFPDWRVSTQGVVILQSIISGPGFPSTNDRGLWRVNGTVELVATTRVPIGSIRPMVAHRFGDPRVRPDGTVVLEAESDDQVEFGRTLWDDEGIWAIDLDGAFEELARVGNPLPGGGDRSFISAVESRFGISGNSSGAISYVATFRNNFGHPQVEGSVALSIDADGIRRRIAAAGDLLPGSATDRFSTFFGPMLDEDGNVVFDADLQDRSSWRDDGIWTTDTDGNVEEILLEDDIVPGAPDHAFDDGPYVPWLSAYGDILFNASYNPSGLSTRKTGLFIRRPGQTVEAVIQVGDALLLDGASRPEKVSLVSAPFAALPGSPLGERTAFTRAGHLLLDIATTASNRYIVAIKVPVSCPADCDLNGELDLFDFLCFQSAFALGEMSADCDKNGTLDFFDFVCFQSAFAIGCN